MVDSIIFGSQVEILDGRYSGRHGIVTEIFPAGMYDKETIYMVEYSLDGNKGMFKQGQLNLVRK